MQNLKAEAAAEAVPLGSHALIKLLLKTSTLPSFLFLHRAVGGN